MSELRDLYQEVILDHNKAPRNFGKLSDANHEAEGYNPLCGDQLKLQVRTEGDRLVDVRFEGSGCAISKASASLMTETVKGKTLAEAEAIFRSMHSLLVADMQAPVPSGLGKLAVFEGVREFPARVKCASLAWHTLHAALGGDSHPVSTEGEP